MIRDPRLVRLFVHPTRGERRANEMTRPRGQELFYNTLLISKIFNANSQNKNWQISSLGLHSYMPPKLQWQRTFLSDPSPQTTRDSAPTMTKFQEEQLPAYKPEDFYPPKVGEVFSPRYQVVAQAWHAEPKDSGCINILKNPVASGRCW